MRKARWLVGWKDSGANPVIYHCISRVVDRRFVFEEKECEAFRMHMRMYENFSGCRALSYCDVEPFSSIAGGAADGGGRAE
jgi:hypothetical protein